MKAVVALAVALQVVLVACGAAVPNRPGTTYEVSDYSVTVPTDLGLAPDDPDPDVVWQNGLTVLTRSQPTAASLNIQTGQLDPTKVDLSRSDAEVVMTTASANLALAGGEVVSGPTAISLPAGAGATAEVRNAGVPVAVVYVVNGDRAASFTATGMPLSDIVAIAQSFRWRDPPGDPLRPPSPPAPSTR